MRLKKVVVIQADHVLSQSYQCSGGQSGPLKLAEKDHLHKHAANIEKGLILSICLFYSIFVITTRMHMVNSKIQNKLMI